MQKEKYTCLNTYSTVKIEESKIVSFNKYDKTSQSFRVYKDGFAGIHFQQGKMSDKEGFALAEKNLELKRPYPFKLEGGKRSRDKKRKILSDTELMAKAKALLAYLTKTYPQFIYSGMLFAQTQTDTQKNSAGMDYSTTDGHNGVQISFKHKKSKDIYDGYFSANFRTFSLKTIKEIADNYLANYETKLKLPKECIIMMAPWELNSLLVQSLNAENLALGTSLLAGKVGEKVFADNFTMIHNVCDAKMWMNTFWDADGIVHKGDKLTYIKNGKILRGYADKRIAAKYNVECTGSAYQDYADIPQNGWMTGTIKETGKSPKEILKAAGKKYAILPLMYSGGGFKEDGTYAMPVQASYLTDGEKILGKLPPFTMRSNMFDMFGKDFIGVSKYTKNWNRGMLLVKMEMGKL
jgi:PmbA protein